MKKIMTILACAGALAASVVAAPSASANGTCATITNGYYMGVTCPESDPGNFFRIAVKCPEGWRWSNWERQGQTIAMQCHGIELKAIHYS